MNLGWVSSPKVQSRFAGHTFRPAQEQGYIVFAYPASSNKPGQAYKLTAKGLKLLAKLKEKPENLHETT